MKKQRLSVAIAVLAAGLLLAGCASKVTKTDQYSGFLPDYSKLQETSSPSGHKTLRWIDPNFKESNYRGVYFSPVVYYPAAKPNDRVSQQTLDKIRNYTDQSMRKAVAERTTILKSPAGSRVLLAKVAITAVSAEDEDVKFYEVVPVAAVVASTMAATGHRTQNTTLFLEAQLIDQDTGKTVLEVVRKNYGKTVNNGSSPVTEEEVKAAIDEMVADTVAFPKQG
ncbi:Protein of uncharacterised function (DUF3313) [Serratia quinivorans]|jgi:hypothetical protein|uniref:DUF3313 domain-containing protein n=1 Tax=Serratia TaxID=613 RepID=UPI00217C6815|nr:DUF3313 domain-containing protein [Serratia quinivorans]CAI0874349.1 Protein of uncharacterised function (DUF3313) [Serratia quinivorans]CAI1169251.1 Protein of uncharacterised function (DUF3313) [Serratia quinivorans]CAI1209931.1 Protein of uncharacterised function (DUF3313) [Serratia quinivorans]CAI1222309.1 Protein of uncharacterised function (DUF3313) [Serratia quinivorans]CAI1225036.1 Protein of uncharacterised function (DUF3313) [Serratia quinivorans]